MVQTRHIYFIEFRIHLSYTVYQTLLKYTICCYLKKIHLGRVKILIHPIPKIFAQKVTVMASPGIRTRLSDFQFNAYNTPPAHPATLMLSKNHSVAVSYSFLPYNKIDIYILSTLRLRLAVELTTDFSHITSLSS